MATSRIINNRYINPRSDFGFKKILGQEESKDNLIAFINSIYPELQVTSLSYLNSEQLGETVKGRRIVYDVLCTTASGEKVITEMQAWPQSYFVSRSIFYASRLISESGRKFIEDENDIKDDTTKTERSKVSSTQPMHRAWDYNFDSVYVICLLNFDLPTDVKLPGDNYIWKYSLREDKYGTLLSPKVRIAYLEVGRFDKKVEELGNIQEKMLFLFKNLDSLKERPEALMDKEFKKFFELAEIAALTEEEREMYYEINMNECDYYNCLEYARVEGEKKGMERGEAVGIEKGREEGQLILIKSLLANGVSMEVIATSIGKSVESIQALIDKGRNE